MYLCVAPHHATHQLGVCMHFHQGHDMNSVLATYSSSRCRCDSTMVEGVAWVGLGGISQ